MGLVILSYPSISISSKSPNLSSCSRVHTIRGRLGSENPSSNSRLCTHKPNIYFRYVGAECKNLAECSTSEELPSISSGCSTPLMQLRSDVFESEGLNLLEETTSLDDLLVLTEEEQQTLAATPAHPAGLYALYASYVAGNLVEQMWNFACPAAVALLHPSLLPVAVVGFFTKLTIFSGGPLVGKFLDTFPRVYAFNFLSMVQTVAQLLSAAMIIHGLSNSRYSTSTILLQPWFVVLVIVGGIERLTGLASGIAVERDWVVLLAGANRPIALAEANSMLNRIDLLCEIAGASLFGIFLSKYSPTTCLKLASALMIVTLPILVLLVCLTNKLSGGVLDRPKIIVSCDKAHEKTPSSDGANLVGRGLDAIWHGWVEYTKTPVLPASLAYVFLCFNTVLAPGGLMTSFLTQWGLSPFLIGGFSGLCSFMGVAATFISASLVEKLGLLKAGAAGLLFQALLLTVAVVVYWSGSLSQSSPLFFFLSLIVLSRLGHMSYDIVGAQILQTGVPASKANLIGTTGVAVESFAELVMLGLAIIANDVSHFGFLAVLSMSSVVGATWMFCRWLTNLTDEQQRLFSCDPRTVIT